MILINGQAGHSIPISDRGFQYGDGLFETMAVKQGMPLCLPGHLERLTHGCQRLNIPKPEWSTLQKEIKTVAGDLQRGVLKIIVTRGASGRGYAPVTNVSANRVITSFDWPDYPSRFREEGIDACLCETRLARNSKLAGLKHLNRLEQVLGRGECDANKVPEGIMLDTDGNLIEGTMSNLFLIQKDRLITPILTHSGIQGVIRARILELSHEIKGLEVRVEKLPPSILAQVDGAFFCNSVMGIWPIKRIAKYHYSIPYIIRQLQRELVDLRIISES